MSENVDEFELEEEEEEELLSVEEELLTELRVNRDELDGMLDTISKAREKCNQLFPEKLDARGGNKYVMEQRLKAISEIFNIELNIRKEKNNSIKTEVELSRKLFGGSNNEVGDRSEKIDEIVEALTKMRKTTKKGK